MARLTRYRRAKRLSLAGLAFAACGGLLYRQASRAQAPDLGFDPAVAHPAYVGSHPRVAFDQHHINVHTAGGRYRPFADLIRNDGYDVVPFDRPFSPQALQGYDVLVSVNALGWEGGAAQLLSGMHVYRALDWELGAYAAAACASVRVWVSAGGSLLLVADHAPAGKAMAAPGMP